MTNEKIKKSLQEHFGDGLVLIVGSGLSCSEGLPGMPAIAEHLNSVLPNRLSSKCFDEWQEVQPLIETNGLEAALMEKEPTAELEIELTAAAIELIEPMELQVISDVILGKRTLRFTRLLSHLLKPDNGVAVVTTNYDRLLEVASEVTNLPVDTMFDGRHTAWLDAKQARGSLMRAVGLYRNKIRKRLRPHLRIFKPHGSIDWYDGSSGPINFSGRLSVPRLIITPGRKKFRRGYDTPFDLHRELANKAIDEASKFLILGYGFNDDHLETHLSQKISSGVKTLIITKALSKRAQELVSKHSSIIAIEESESGGSQIYIEGGQCCADKLALWDLHTFIQEVLEP